MNYRADIDGLRAIAVLSVLLFHLDEQFITGGFVGVDIFFVISGYLITRLITNELSNTGQFKFSNFYLRRVRRLFPAMVFTFVISIVCAALLFIPEHLAQFGQSLVAATLSFSNFLFWSESGYFDNQNIYKPLLHTWSLSVEEQFYLIWPAMLLIGFRFISKAWFPWLFLLFGCASLYLNLSAVAHEETIGNLMAKYQQEPFFDIRSTLFYLLPFRIFEFVIGGILVWLPSLQNKSTERFFLPELLFITGLALIAYSFVAIDGELIFPSTNALTPCLGAAFIIYSGPQHRLVKILANAPMITIGLLSYSLYLIHWPIIVFYRYWKYEELTRIDYLLIIVSSLALAYFMHRFIETPFRKVEPRNGGNRKFIVSSIVIAAILVGIGWNASSSGGWLWRYPDDVVAKLSLTRDDYRKDYWVNMEQQTKGFSNNGSTKVLIIGDSMAADFLNALVENDYTQQLDLATHMIKHNCKSLIPAQSYSKGVAKCRVEHQSMIDNPLLDEAEIILLASYWWEDLFLPRLTDTINYLNEQHGKRIFVLGSKTQKINGMYFLSKHVFDRNNHLIRAPYHPRTKVINTKLQKLEADYEYFDLLDLFCNIEGCQLVADNGELLIFDNSHMTIPGAKIVGAKFIDTNWFKKLVNHPD